MPLYQYVALTDEGTEQRARIDAPDEDSARQALLDNSLYVVDIQQVRQAKNVEDYLARVTAIKPAVLVVFFRQLATMINADMTALQALTVLEEQQENPKFKVILGEVVASLRSGEQLYVALSRHPEVFTPLHVAMVRSGEESGNLDGALLELANQLEKQLALRRAIRSATVYPKVVLGIAFLIVSGLLMTIVPRFATMFKETVASAPSCAGQAKPSDDLPGMTQAVVSLSHLLYPEGDKNLAWLAQVVGRFALLFIIFLLVRMLIRRVMREQGPREAWDRYKLKAPMRIGPLVQKIAVARFARTFASLLNAGVPIGQAMEIVADTSGNSVISKAVLEARERTLAGQTLAAPLARAGVFPHMVTRMIEVGETSGALSTMLEKIAIFYEGEVDAQIKGLSSLIEPLMIFLVGGIVGTIIISVYLPIFKIYDLVGAC